MQLIDTSLGRSTHIAFGKESKLQLIDADNINLWEEEIIVGERIILITLLISKAVDYVLKLKNNNMRISYFKKINYLISILIVDELDTKIRSQDIEEDLFVILRTRVIFDGESKVQVIESDIEINKTDATIAKETVNIEDNDNDKKSCWIVK